MHTHTHNTHRTKNTHIINHMSPSCLYQALTCKPLPSPWPNCLILQTFRKLSTHTWFLASWYHGWCSHCNRIAPHDKIAPDCLPSERRSPNLEALQRLSLQEETIYNLQHTIVPCCKNVLVLLVCVVRERIASSAFKAADNKQPPMYALHALCEETLV
jgi:hypothetical protein